MKVFAHSYTLLILTLLGAGLTPLQSQISNRDDEIGRKMNQWAREGSAAGLKEVQYENRDGFHSPLDLNLFPQVRGITAPLDPPNTQPNPSSVGPAQHVRPKVTFGNCSMAATPEQGGSLPRLYMTQGQGLQFLAAQYFQNNLFFYPEHQDHDMGENGNDGFGFGDLYPTNTPYMVISQGSSYTDIPFLKAFLSAYGSLSNDAQSGLTKNQVVMPVLQSLFRQSSKLVTNQEDYLSGKAHPVVFDWNQFDEARFVELAHNLTARNLPPVAILQVKSETSTQAGKDFFEAQPGVTEVLGNTPGSVARIFRGSAYQREVVLDASRSADLTNRSLNFRWVLLQGDPERVKIEPSADGVTAKITVAWHPEFANSVGVKTRRVEIGLFASNGGNWSAPAFFTYYMLPNEQRYYDEQGRLAEIYYRAWNTNLGLPQAHSLNWLMLGRHMSGKNPPKAYQLLREKLPAEVVKKLIALSDELEMPQARWRSMLNQPERKSDADALMGIMTQRTSAVVREPYAPGQASVFSAVETALNDLADQADLFQRHQTQWLTLLKSGTKPESKAIFDQTLKQMIDLQVMDPVGNHFALRYQAKDLIAGERYQMRIFNLNLFSEVLFAGFLERRPVPNLTDPRLTHAKNWRDMYRYDKAGNCLGWTRIAQGKTYEFNLEGKLMPQGRSGPAVEVNYQLDPGTQQILFAPKS